jgi:hypothetical protein
MAIDVMVVVVGLLLTLLVVPLGVPL